MSTIQDDKERLSRAYLGAISVTAMFLMPFSAILIILSDEIVLLLLGNLWYEAIPIFEILALILVFRMSYKFSDSLARAMGTVYKADERL
jgi:O-antigen/teichoic acid export membrane protein